MVIHEISAAEERNKKWGAENKIGHSVLSNEKQSLSFFLKTTLWTPRICRMQSSKAGRKQKLHRIAFHGGGGEGSAVKRMKCPNPTGYVPCSFF